MAAILSRPQCVLKGDINQISSLQMTLISFTRVFHEVCILMGSKMRYYKHVRLNDKKTSNVPIVEHGTVANIC